MEDSMAGRFLLRPELEERKGDSLIRCALGRLVKAGQFSRRVHLSGGTVACVEDEIDAYADAKVAARDQSPTKAAAWLSRLVPSQHGWRHGISFPGKAVDRRR
jgi:predicted DNA-binding transcriptional regulator AlpA